MLSESEKKGVERLLSFLSEDELLSLSKTVTNSQIVVADAKDAVRSISSYTECPAELLKRRRLKRNVLFQYLHAEGVVVSSKSEKHVLAARIMAHWGSDPVQSANLMEVDEEEDANPPALPYSTATGWGAPLPSVTSPPLPLASHPHTDASGCQGRDGVQAGAPALPPRPAAEVAPSGVQNDSQAALNVEDHEMALAFVRWFYRMLNSSHPQAPPPTDGTRESFGPQHFYPDCNLKVLNATSRHMEEVSGAEGVVGKLLSCVRDDLVCFNPNLETGGVRGVLEPHGLRVVSACGTLHRVSDVIGLFEQQFGLVRDPSQEYNWRIKFMKLRLLLGPGVPAPTLEYMSSLPGT